MNPPIVVVKGDDPTLVAQAARTVVHDLVGDADPGLVVEEHGGASSDDLDVGALIDAVMTPAFLVDRRVVVVRDAGRITSAEATRIASALEHPLETSTLVLVAGGGTLPQSLTKMATAIGTVIDASAGTGKNRSRWIDEHLRSAPVQLDGRAAQLLSNHLGEDLGRLEGLLDTLAATYGPGATIGAEELAPFLGQAGAVPPWDLTDAIDRGDTEGAIAVLHRMAEAGGRAAPELVAILHRHFDQMLRLDGLGLRSDEEAAAVLGVKSAFVAKKARIQADKLGTAKLSTALGLVAQADVDVKGMTGLSAEVVLEVLVARLARLSRATSRRPARR